MEIRESLVWTFIKRVVVNFLIIISFSGLFKESLMITSFYHGFVAAVILTLLYMFVKPMLTFISIIPIIMTLGLFMIFINAFLIELVSYLLAPNFQIASFASAMFLALFISLLNMLLNSNDRKIIIKKY